MNRWEKISVLGSGGQGTVHKALDTQKYNHENLFDKFDPYFRFTSSASRRKEFPNLVKTISSISKLDDAELYGALKELHPRTSETIQDAAKLRIHKEIEIMNNNLHPNLLRILDYDKNKYKWFVSEYYPNGTLNGINRDIYKGNVSKCLKAIRPLIEGVSLLHEKGVVHRDIKPQNIFIGNDNELILGDFGLVFLDEEKTRVTETFESVGTHAWMPAWAFGKRIEDVTFSFDIFSIAKVFWYMISGKDYLNLWYFGPAPRKQCHL